MKKDTLLISAFPGCGKSTIFMMYNKSKNIQILDSDSAFFSKKNFPKNYVEHIKEKIGEVDIIFISSHKEVRDALREENIDFHIFYPSIDRKKEFLENYKNRGSGSIFIKKMSECFETFINGIESEDFNGKKYVWIKKGVLSLIMNGLLMN